MRLKELLRANRTKDAFPGVMSHELRTPLSIGIYKNVIGNAVKFANEGKVCIAVCSDTKGMRSIGGDFLSKADFQWAVFFFPFRFTFMRSET